MRRYLLRVVLVAVTGAVGFSSVASLRAFAERVTHAEQLPMAATHRLPDGLYTALAQLNPYIQQTKLIASDSAASDHFGGNHIVIVNLKGRVRPLGIKRVGEIFEIANKR